jgi:polar amino acid transport system substrate-binding protein
MSVSLSSIKLLGLTAAVLVLLVACGPEPKPAQPAAGGNNCSKEDLPVINAGQLTIATDKPAYPPWFENNDPTNGKGFESAVAYAVADEMGFSDDEVEWVVEPFNKSYAPGPKDFDFDINQISITSKREEAVDFSEPYYDANQALVALKGTDATKAESLDDLKSLKLGAQVGTTSYSYVVQFIQPTEDPYTYETTNDAKSALKAGQIAGVVVDLPTAFYITAAEIPNSTIVGQFALQGEGDHFGLLFEDGNPLVGCVNEAIRALEEDGTLADIQDQWLSQVAGVPVLH